jgi:D-sedoheptulose 7-phosphate isomerase
VTPDLATHLERLAAALRANADALRTVDGWGERVATILLEGGRLLAAGNGGSAAQAQHLTAELVGRYLEDRRPFSAISLHAETSSLTALCNDYGADQAFARGLRAHARPGDVLVALSTSGRSANVVEAAYAARELDVAVLALTGPAPNPLAEVADEVAAIEAESTATVQELHLVGVHVLCAAIDRAVFRREGR